MSGYRDIVQDWDLVIIRSSENAQISKQTPQKSEITKDYFEINDVLSWIKKTNLNEKMYFNLKYIF